MKKMFIGLTLLLGLSGCGLITTQAVYEEIRAQRNAKSVGTGTAPNPALPSYDAYKKERGQLASEPR